MLDLSSVETGLGAKNQTDKSSYYKYLLNTVKCSIFKQLDTSLYRSQFLKYMLPWSEVSTLR